MQLYENRPSGTVDRARALRRAASPIERRLLRALRDAFPHLKWRHQAPIGPFYTDFLCFSERLVIELDGDSHADTADYDAQRTALMAREGFRLIRFINADVVSNLEGVLTTVAAQLAKSPSPPGAGAPGPLSQRERGRAAKPRRGEGDDERTKEKSEAA